MEERNKKEEQVKGKKWPFVVISLLVPLLAAAIIISTYGSVQEYVRANRQNPFEYGRSLKELLKENYVLYKNLQEKLTGKPQRYSDLYISDIKGLTHSLYNLLLEYIGAETTEAAYYSSVEQVFNDTMRENVENNAVRELGICDYYIEDLDSGISISNTVTGSLRKEDYFYYLEILFDENGFAEVVDAQSENSDRLIKNAADCLLIKNKLLEGYLEESRYLGESRDDLFGNSSNYDILQYGEGPENCRIIYGFTKENWEKISRGYLYLESKNGSATYITYMDIFGLYDSSGIYTWLQIAGLSVFVLAFLLPLRKLGGTAVFAGRIFRMPAEILVFLFVWLAAFLQEFVGEIARLLEGISANNLQAFFGLSGRNADDLAFLKHALILYLLFLAAWYLGLCARPLWEKGIRGYVREYSLIYRFFPFCKKHFLKLADSLEHLDLTRKAHRQILKIVLINGLTAVILLMASPEFALLLVYCLLVYLALRVYVSRIQKKYRLLLSRIREISQGDLNVEIREDMGIFNPLKEELLKIQGGFRAAVEAETRSQRMKSELITNVSHDLKTPLTTITTYVDLMKDENATPEQKQEYLEILEKKCQRLKVLIEDLFEVSKATSGAMNLRYVNVDICSLIKQVRLEIADKLEAARLDVRLELPEEKVIVSLDSQKTYRIFENLFQNIAKYALEGTRVYVRGKVEEGQIHISLKNISASEITMDASELAERFVRGDASRNTEGSGLGLAIAKSLTELQGGIFRLENDGDLFKVFLVFPCSG